LVTVILVRVTALITQ